MQLRIKKDNHQLGVKWAGGNRKKVLNFSSPLILPAYECKFKNYPSVLPRHMLQKCVYTWENITVSSNTFSYKPSKTQTGQKMYIQHVSIVAMEKQ
jgi:hypothetical protein